MTPAPHENTRLVRSLCAWFEATRRDLPWRGTLDPYAIWISEAMLQQTRVEAVLEAYARFMERLPDVRALAQATEEEVVALWSGLGYYRRARALRRAAGVIVSEHGGRFPRTREELLALPGVGPYTAGALLSIAFQRSEPLVDGNVVRVLSRIDGLDLPPGSERTRRLWARAADLVPPAVEPALPGPTLSPGTFNQALMELGALVCLPRGARCEACPVAAFCRARSAGRVEELPLRAAPREAVDVSIEMLFVRRGAEVLFERRPARGRMAGMWELPTRELSPDGEPTHLWPSDSNAEVELGEELGVLTHAITHHRIRATVRSARLLTDESNSIRSPFAWLEPGAPGEVAWTGLARKALARFDVRTFAAAGEERA